MFCARNTAKYPTMHKIPPPPHQKKKNCPAQNVNSAEVEKPRPRIFYTLQGISCSLLFAHAIPSAQNDLLALLPV